jgi:lipopolysaccharide biosynthesis glycosyltransferase
MFCCDPGFFQHLAVALASLLVNNQRRSLDVTIVASARDVAAERRLLSVLPAHPDANVTIRHFALDKFRRLPTSAHFTIEAYLRILAIDTLPPDIEKILYLDCDVVVAAALDDLWETDISSHMLAAVPEPFVAGRPQALGLPEGAIYVNSGVLLFNVRRWRERRLTAHIVAYAEREGSNLVFFDQDAINALLHAEILSLPLRWNCQARMFPANRSLSKQQRASFAAATVDPAIIHYTTAQKPWMFTAVMPKRALYWHYLAMTAWRNAPPTRRSLPNLPEALYNRIAYAFGSACSFERFLQSTNAGRVLVRGGQAARWASSLLRSRALPSVLRRIAAVAPRRRRSWASNRPASQDRLAGMMRGDSP